MPNGLPFATKLTHVLFFRKVPRAAARGMHGRSINIKASSEGRTEPWLSNDFLGHEYSGRLAGSAGGGTACDIRAGIAWSGMRLAVGAAVTACRAVWPSPPAPPTSVANPVHRCCRCHRCFGDLVAPVAAAPRPNRRHALDEWRRQFL
jgi:hypothetical protein